MTAREWMRTLEQLARERQALNETYQALQKRAWAEAEEARRTDPEKGVVPGLIDLVMQLGNFVNVEREHADMLWALLVVTLTGLAEAYDFELPPDWPQAPR